MTKDQVPNCQWHDQYAPSAGDIANMADETMAMIPDYLRTHLHHIIFRVEDFPDEETLNALEVDDPFGLLGLYHGTSLAEKSTLDIVPQPDMIILYRRPILDYWAAGNHKLANIVSHVVIHEIGHHFGLSDEDMHIIESAIKD